MSVRIAILVEGATEQAFIPKLREFLQARLASGTMPKLDIVPCDGRVPTGEKLRRIVANLLSGKNAADAVIALTDVYTGTREFSNAQDAKEKMRGWVGDEPRFSPHVALHDFEAWLLPFWSDIQSLAGSARAIPGAHPEQVNHDKPPAHRLQEVFRTGSKGKAYVKPRDAARILRDNDLAVAAESCPELKAFLNTILLRCGTAAI
ncbi:MAG: DUF4276 family protein [Rhodocyclaceae bacterium]|nr:MAG: DUF4276 family protein [Rhodocyclaceae bacterium]